MAKAALLKLQHFDHVARGSAWGTRTNYVGMEGTLEGKRYQEKPTRQSMATASSERGRIIRRYTGWFVKTKP